MFSLSLQFFFLETQFCTSSTGRGKPWVPASGVILVLCQLSLSCKHTNSPWHGDPSWDLSKACQWLTSSLPWRVRLLAASLWAKGSCSGVCFVIFKSKMAALQGERRGLSPGREGLGRAGKHETEENTPSTSRMCSPFGKDGSGPAPRWWFQAVNYNLAQGCSEALPWGLTVPKPDGV